MKKFNGRKLLALMMTLIMLLSLMPAAFADGEGSISINEPVRGVHPRSG